jgi:hypothetical protein
MRLTRSISPQGAGQDGPHRSLPSERTVGHRQRRPAMNGNYCIWSGYRPRWFRRSSDRTYHALTMHMSARVAWC